MNNCTHEFVKLKEYKTDNKGVTVVCAHCGQVRNVNIFGEIIIVVEQGRVVRQK